MKISRNWLQAYFDQPLPTAEALSDALTFHVFEIDGVEKYSSQTAVIDDILDVKVTANRGHDCLSHRGIAKEISAILNIPLKADPLVVELGVAPFGIGMHIEDTKRVPVGAAAHVTGVKIGPSPTWLKERLESIGQRSINNVVDATNFVMFDIGMPTHAFDATSFKKDDQVIYGIRTSEKGEKIALLGGASIELSGQEAVIMNASREPVDIGGVKGGMLAELKSDTTEVVLSASKFAPVETRRASQRFNQRTEAAKRFENDMSDDLAIYGIRAVAELVCAVAGGTIISYGVERARTVEGLTVSVSLQKINAVLGTELSMQQVEDVIHRLGFVHSISDDLVIVVTPPHERLDILIPEDIVEEVGRIIGYDHVQPVALPAIDKLPDINANFSRISQICASMIAKGFSEVYTSVFVEKGEREVLNKVGGDRPFLRDNLLDGLLEALERNVRIKDILGISKVRLFEIGSVWKDGGEEIMVATAEEKGETKEDKLSDVVEATSFYAGIPSSTLERYQTFSRYPFIVRDIAMWVPAGTDPHGVLGMIREQAGSLIVRSSLFDTFEKGGRTSLAFRLIFQSFEKTLTDSEVNEIMGRVAASIVASGWEVR